MARNLPHSTQKTCKVFYLLIQRSVTLSLNFRGFSGGRFGIEKTIANDGSSELLKLNVYNLHMHMIMELIYQEYAVQLFISIFLMSIIFVQIDICFVFFDFVCVIDLKSYRLSQNLHWVSSSCQKKALVWTQQIRMILTFHL